MRDADKTAALISLLRRRVPREVAGLAADAMHPFGELGDWPPDGKARSEAKEVARAIAGRVGRYADAVPTEDLKSWIRWAFCEYARIAEQGSPAARAFAQSANRPELRARERIEAIARGMANARAARTEQLLQAMRASWDQAKWSPLLHPSYRHLLVPLDEYIDGDGTRVVLCHAMVTCVDKRVEDIDKCPVLADRFSTWPISTSQQVWSAEEESKYPPSDTWEEAVRVSEARLAALQESSPITRGLAESANAPEVFANSSTRLSGRLPAEAAVADTDTPTRPQAEGPVDAKGRRLVLLNDHEQFIQVLAECTHGYGVCDGSLRLEPQMAWLSLPLSKNADARFGPFTNVGIYWIDQPVEVSISYDELVTLWSFATVTFPPHFWWPLKIIIEPLFPEIVVIRTYAGTPGGVQGSRCKPLLAILPIAELARQGASLITESLSD